MSIFGKIFPRFFRRPTPLKSSPHRRRLHPARRPLLHRRLQSHWATCPPSWTRCLVPPA